MDRICLKILIFYSWCLSKWRRFRCNHYPSNPVVISRGDWRDDLATHPAIPNAIPVLRRTVLYKTTCIFCGKVELIEGYDQKDRD